MVFCIFDDIICTNELVLLRRCSVLSLHQTVRPLATPVPVCQRRFVDVFFRRPREPPPHRLYVSYPGSHSIHCDIPVCGAGKTVLVFNMDCAAVGGLGASIFSCRREDTEDRNKVRRRRNVPQLLVALVEIWVLDILRVFLQ